MSQCYTSQKEGSIPIHLLTPQKWPAVLKGLSSADQKWIQSWDFEAKPHQCCVLPNKEGVPSQVLYGVSEKEPLWDGACLASQLPKDHTYRVEGLSEDTFLFFAQAWGLEHYKFSRYKTDKDDPKKTKLFVPKDSLDFLTQKIEVSYQVRDWINTPASDLTPEAFSEIAEGISKEHKATCHISKGADLEKNYPMVHAVGKASINKPFMVDMRWGKETHPKITLVGKGVTFDTGGLDIKPPSNMLLMKKDMGGAAQALGLADLIMRTNLPVQLRLLLPMAENSIGAEAFRPSDVLTSRKGFTVEVGDTDAEGRLLLADALTAACEENPDYLIDFATLTGAARVAVGTDITAFFSNEKGLSDALKAASEKSQDPLWELPLWGAYASMLSSSIADIKSCSAGGYGGATTAALFLKKFVPDSVKWAHLDLMGWNMSSKPGRPVGGEVMGLYAAYEFLKKTCR